MKTIQKTTEYNSDGLSSEILSPNKIILVVYYRRYSRMQLTIATGSLCGHCNIDPDDGIVHACLNNGRHRPVIASQEI